MPSSRVTGIAFEVAAGSIPSSSASASIVVTSGVAISRRLSRSGNSTGRGHTARDLEVGRVVSTLAQDERVLAGAGRAEEVAGLLAAHHPGLGLHLVELEPAALEDAVVGPALELEALRQALLVDVERVRVLHHELADAKQAAARAGLVAALRLEVVEHLRQLPVALQLARMEGERLLVRQRGSTKRRPARSSSLNSSVMP